MTVKRELTSAHPRSPEELSVGDDYTILTGRTHGCDVLGGVGRHVKSYGSSGGAVKDAVDASGGSGAGPASRYLRQFPPGGVVELGPGSFGTSGVEASSRKTS